MTTALTIQAPLNVPAYLSKYAYLIEDLDKDAMAGSAVKMPPRVKLSGKQFTLVDLNGVEAAYPPAKMVTSDSDGNVYMPVIVLRAKKDLDKAWYATKYMPGQDEYKAPDCWSRDAKRPDSSVAVPQSDLCAHCPNNAFGSGTDQNGNPTKGKACSDSKILAVLIPGFGVYQFKIPPASLKTWDEYARKMKACGIPLLTAKTLVGFDLTVSNPVLVFNNGGVLPDEYIPKLIELSQTKEVLEIVQPEASDRAAEIAAPAPTARTEAPPVEEYPNINDPAPAPQQAQQPATAGKGRGKGKAKETAPPPPADDLGLGLGLSPEPEQETQAELLDDVSDDQLRKELGL
jgi:hypothetical protein